MTDNVENPVELTKEEALLAEYNVIAAEKGLTQRTEPFESLKDGQAALKILQACPSAAPPVVKEKKPVVRGPNQGVGAFAKDLLLAGKPTKEVLAAVHEKFPDAKTTASCIAYYKNALVKAGKLPSTRPAAPAAPASETTEAPETAEAAAA